MSKTELKQKIGEVVGLLEEGEAGAIELGFQSRWVLVENYHRAGKIMEKLIKNTKQVEVVQQVAQMSGKSTRTIYDILKMVKKYPDINKLPEGKKINWRTIVNKYLPDPNQNKPDHICRIWRCPTCGLAKT